jgi:uncharacterized membrane protein
MAGCDEFGISIERRLHGALGPAEGAALDAHLSTCGRCRTFEAAARRTEAVMRGAADEAARSVDFEAVRAVVERWRRRTRLAGLALLLPFTVALAGLVTALRRGRPGEEVLLLGGVVAGLAAVAAVTALVRARRAARASRLEEVIPLLRRQLARRARVVLLALLILPAQVLWLAWQAGARSGRGAILMGALAALTGVAWLALLVWKRPQLERDRALLDGVDRP